ncbi:hypothetical protein RHGRI_013327 [Rhododendron griersonianum]|uniref:O-methyltransferase dimerisation domain-containing protein n=1 Tax=Rhododendron griersonianum TaxID=479676 RepID=A0AAV6K5H3_9ERIC|nr:hypothetical protein RHGRI_013327 [Rhododendron griersonianum]
MVLYSAVYVDMAVVKCAIQLGIPDALETHDGPATLPDLSSALHHIMRFLIHHKIFKEDPTGCLQMPLSRLLLTKNSDKSMADFRVVWGFHLRYYYTLLYDS